MVFIRTICPRNRQVAIDLRMSGFAKHGSRLVTSIWSPCRVQWAMGMVGKALYKQVLDGLLCSMVQFFPC
jgi:hypothetical protein